MFNRCEIGIAIMSNDPKQQKYLMLFLNRDGTHAPLIFDFWANVPKIDTLYFHPNGNDYKIEGVIENSKFILLMEIPSNT